MKDDYIFPFLWMRKQSEETLRTEIGKIQECGIHSFCVESRPHPDFCGDGWWQDMDIVLDEAKKRDMHVWILDDAHFPTGMANGAIAAEHPELARRYLMMQFADCTGPHPAVTLDVNLLMTKGFTLADLGRTKEPERPLIEETALLGVTAYLVTEGDTLLEEGYDLTDEVTDAGLLHWDVPGGVWRICVSFTTTDFGAKNNYINYIDAASARVLLDAVYEPHYEKYEAEFGKTIRGFFSDEPGFYNVEGFAMGDALGRKEMALPWCAELAPLLEEALGEEWKRNLPFLWLDTQDDEAYARARHAYMDQVTRLYAKNFSGQIGAWCEEHGVEYIGHVIEDNGEHTRLGNGAGHYFRALSGQHMAGIDTIGSQILPGNPYADRHGIAYVGDGVFFHFGLSKLGASAAQIDPKKQGRLLCEAFGAYGWGFGVRSMKWLTDFLLANGVNRLVPHAFSMADYPDEDCPPHFYAQGNNGQFPYFAELMKYANRMCGLFSGGKNVPVAALLYPAESDWMNDCMPVEVPARELTEHQIDFEILPQDVFFDREYFGTKIADGTLTVNEREMYILVIPGTPKLNEEFFPVIDELQNAHVPMLFVEQMPKEVCGCEVIPLTDLSGLLRSEGYYDIRLIPKKPDDTLFGGAGLSLGMTGGGLPAGSMSGGGFPAGTGFLSGGGTAAALAGAGTSSSMNMFPGATPGPGTASPEALAAELTLKAEIHVSAAPAAEADTDLVPAAWTAEKNIDAVPEEENAEAALADAFAVVSDADAASDDAPAAESAAGSDRTAAAALASSERMQLSDAVPDMGTIPTPGAILFMGSMPTMDSTMPAMGSMPTMGGGFGGGMYTGEDLDFAESANKYLLYYHYKKEHSQYFLFNTSLSENVSAEVVFDETEDAFRYDGMEDAWYSVPQEKTEAGITIPVSLVPYESALYVFGAKPENVQVKWEPKWESVWDISENWKTSRVRAIDYPNFPQGETVETLRPVSELYPEFSGIMCYEKEIALGTFAWVRFEAEYVYECAELFVNGKSAGKRLTPPYAWDIDELCTDGVNQIRVEVANTPVRETQGHSGMFGPAREVLEPSGMFGQIVLKVL